MFNIRDRDVAAEIAAGISEILDASERVSSVMAILRVDEIEARLLISSGRRIKREKGKAA